MPSHTTDDIPLEDAIQALEDAPSATHDPEAKQEVEAEKKPLKSLSEVPKEEEMTVSKVVILSKENSRTYKVKFLLNQEHFEGLVSTEFNAQVIEISNEEKRDKRICTVAWTTNGNGKCFSPERHYSPLWYCKIQPTDDYFPVISKD